METLSNGAWKSTTTKGVFFGLSCPATGYCVAAGTYNTPAGRVVGVIQTLSAGSWRSIDAPTTGLQYAAASTTLNSVSCPVIGSCTAVGSSTATSGAEHGLIETLSVGTWTAITAPTVGLRPAPVLGGQNYIDLMDVTCPSSSSCAAEGYYDVSFGHAFFEDEG
jgi:hypothetical protein